MTDVLRQCKARRGDHRCRHTNDDGHAKHRCEHGCCSWYDYSTRPKLKARQIDEGAVELFVIDS